MAKGDPSPANKDLGPWIRIHLRREKTHARTQRYAARLDAINLQKTKLEKESHGLQNQAHTNLHEASREATQGGETRRYVKPWQPKLVQLYLDQLAKPKATPKPLATQEEVSSRSPDDLRNFLNKKKELALLQPAIDYDVSFKMSVHLNRGFSTNVCMIVSRPQSGKETSLQLNQQ